MAGLPIRGGDADAGCGLAVDVVTACRKPIANPTRAWHSDTCARWHGGAPRPRSRGKIAFVQGFDFVEVLLERLPHHTGQDCVAVFNFRKLKLRTGRALI